MPLASLDSGGTDLPTVGGSTSVRCTASPLRFCWLALAGAGLGQITSGNSSLSPGACRADARPPNWPYGRLSESVCPGPSILRWALLRRGRECLLRKVAGQTGCPLPWRTASVTNPPLTWYRHSRVSIGRLRASRLLSAEQREGRRVGGPGGGNPGPL